MKVLSLFACVAVLVPLAHAPIERYSRERDKRLFEMVASTSPLRDE